MRSSAKRSRRDARNIAIALALLALAVIMFLVTIVKFEERMHGDGMSQTAGEAKPPRAPTSGAAAFSRREALDWGSGTNLSLFDDTKGTDEDFDRGGDHVDRRDFSGGVAVAAGPYSDRPEYSVGAVQAELFCGFGLVAIRLYWSRNANMSGVQS